MLRARKKFHLRSVSLQNPAGPSCALHQFDEEVLNDLLERESLERLNQPLTAESENLLANWNSLVFCPGYKVRNTHAETVETAWHHRLKRRQRWNARVTLLWSIIGGNKFPVYFKTPIRLFFCLFMEEWKTDESGSDKHPRSGTHLRGQRQRCNNDSFLHHDHITAHATVIASDEGACLYTVCTVCIQTIHWDIWVGYICSHTILNDDDGDTNRF